jgi:hypothetical protein
MARARAVAGREIHRFSIEVLQERKGCERWCSITTVQFMNEL